ncbi:MAG: gas vesicle protein K, partial [Pseudomonadota bacterium]
KTPFVRGWAFIVSSPLPACVFDLETGSDEIMAAVMDGVRNGRIPSRLEIDPDNVSHDLAKLVLTLIEFLRQLMEAQAIRRMEAGSLTEEQEESLGMTLFQSREKIIELAGEFGINADELTLDLGPLGKLV